MYIVLIFCSAYTYRPRASPKARISKIFCALFSNIYMRLIVLVMGLQQTEVYFINNLGVYVAFKSQFRRSFPALPYGQLKMKVANILIHLTILLDTIILFSVLFLIFCFQILVEENMDICFRQYLLHFSIF